MNVSPAKYDTFISYNSRDRRRVVKLAGRLRAEGLKVWLDVDNLIPGEIWQSAIDRVLKSCDSCCVFVGPRGLSAWQREETQVAVARRVETGDRFRVILVLLPGAGPQALRDVSAFLTATTWVEFEKSIDEEEPLRRLVCGIRGKEPGPRFDPAAACERRLTGGGRRPDLSWIKSALAAHAPVRFMFG